jgi:hypothetical protein
MITKTILGATAAAFIAAGSLGATTTTASATYFGGPGFYFGYGPHPHGHKVCKPIYKKVKWQDYYGHWHSKVKIVDYKCWWKPYGGYGDGYNDGWGSY